MTRTTTLALFGVFVAQGCIIYEDRPHELDRCGEEEPCEDTGWTGGGTTGETEIRADLELTVREARAGQQLLSTLVNTGDAIDLLAVESVTFSRDVAVLDMIPRTDEVVLLLAVHAEAAPGPIEVWVTSTGEQGWILDEPFDVVTDDGGCTTGQGGTGTTTDTACP
jgi:hypothetical protein